MPPPHLDAGYPARRVGIVLIHFAATGERFLTKLMIAVSISDDQADTPSQELQRVIKSLT